MAGNCTHTDFSQGLRWTSRKTPTAGPSQDLWGPAPTGTSARVGGGPACSSQQQARARLGGELHLQRALPGLATDHTGKTNNRPRLGLEGNSSNKDLSQDWRGTNQQNPATGRSRGSDETHTQTYTPQAQASIDGVRQEPEPKSRCHSPQSVKAGLRQKPSRSRGQ